MQQKPPPVAVQRQKPRFKACACQIQPGKNAVWTSLQIPYEKLGAAQHERFLDMIRNGKKADPDGRQGMSCIRVVRAVYQAYESHSAVKVARQEDL